MKIEILQLTEGAKKAKGLTVVIDVFRAFTTACFIMNNGANAIYPTGSVDDAFRLKSILPDCLLVGERNEVIVPGFDFGNSPANIEHFDFSGKIIKPFCTHEGSGMGQSERDIKRLCPNANVEKGLAIYGSSVSRSQKDFEKWI